jgi:DtxR family Mn-dependent transcriptional regulator
MPRKVTLSASLEDYLEAIYNLVQEKHVARSKEIAKLLNVSNSSVTGALQALGERKLINYAPYEVITLTEEGEAVAKSVVRRHQVLRDFFIKVLEVAEDEAESAACAMEHSLSPVIMDRLIRYVEFTEACPVGGTRWREGVGYQCRHGHDLEQCQSCVAEQLAKTMKSP